jgi:hypothetical protein
LTNFQAIFWIIAKNFFFGGANKCKTSFCLGPINRHVSPPYAGLVP